MSFIKNNIITDCRGTLSYTQNNELPFDIKRIFYLSNLSSTRGGHSHYKCEQILYCINGSCDLYCSDGNTENRYIINNTSGGFYTPNNHWLEITNFRDNCIVLVLCSHLFDTNDYCRDKKLFYNHISKKSQHTIDKISLNNIVKHNSQFKRELLNKFDRILSNGQFTYGDETKEFETKFSKYIGVDYCISCSNGTTALILALQSLNLEDGSEVLIQTNSYVADVIAIVNNKLNIKWIEIDEKNLNIDVNKIEENITNKTKALLLVHLYGICCNMDRILEIKNKHNLYLIEDCAQAHGSMWKNKKLGSFGDISCFSFYPSKNLGAVGEAGCVLTNNINYYKLINSLKFFGQKGVYDYVYIGNNYKSSNLIMASLNLKIDYLDSFNEKRSNAVLLYKTILKDNNNITFLEVDKNNYVNCHLCVIIVNDRDNLMKHLNNNNIECGIHYPNPLYLTEAYIQYESKYTNFNSLSKKIISLPIYAEIEKHEIIFICDIINSFYA